MARRRGSKLTAEQERVLAVRAQDAETAARAELSRITSVPVAPLLKPRTRGTTRAAKVIALEYAVAQLWKRRKQLTAADARRIRRAMHQVRKAKAARWELAESGLRIAFGEARKIAGVLPVEDLAQEGRIGLYRAAMRFDPRRGLRFSTYARWWCRAAITRAVDQHGRTIRMPAGAIERRRNLLKLIREADQHGERWTTRDLAETAGIPKEEVARLLDSLDDTQSLDAPVPGSDGWRDRLLVQVTPDESTPDPDAELVEHERAQQIRAAIECLPARQARIIRLLYGLDDGERRTLADVGRVFGMSRERIRQLRNEALVTLRGLL